LELTNIGTVVKGVLRTSVADTGQLKFTVDLMSLTAASAEVEGAVCAAVETTGGIGGTGNV